MTADEKLAAILAAVQVDTGNRGLAELFAACPGDFAAACRIIADDHAIVVTISTGFYIPSATPPAYETDGPLGDIFLRRAFNSCGVTVVTGFFAEPDLARVLHLAHRYCELPTIDVGPESRLVSIAVERSGPGAGGVHYNMRGRDITGHHIANLWRAGDVSPLAPTQGTHVPRSPSRVTIGIGDGGNEIGMGKLPHDLVARTIPNGDLIHCRVPTDHLIVAGVSNWGAYALAAGVYVLRGVTPPDDLFDPDREREILEVMVREGPLVDGVTGKQTATVDGLSWDDYVRPLIRIRDILKP